MALTRPRINQINTVVTTISDPITVINQGGTIANVDIGFIFNRDFGSSANVAIFWDQSANSFVTAFTTSSGTTNANIVISKYADLSTGNLYATTLYGNISNTESNIFVTGNLIPTANITYDLGSPTQRWREGWFSGSTIHIGNESVSVGEDGTWSFSSNGGKFELGTTKEFNPPNATISGNVKAAEYLYPNGVSIFDTISNSINTANTNLKGYTDNLVTSANTNMKGYTDNLVTSANTSIKGYVDGQITNLINGAPGTLDTLAEIAEALGNDANLSVTLTNMISNVQSNVNIANTNMKGYVDSEISTTTLATITANTNLKGYTDNLVTTANTNLKGYTDNLVSTANINLKGYVDSEVSTTTLAITTANTNLKGYTDNLVSTANINLKGYVDQANTIQSNQIAGANTAITTANTNMKGYVDAIDSALTSNAAVQSGEITNLYSIKANLASPTFTGNVVFDSIGAIRLPNGTSAQRTNGAAGEIRYNTETGTFEGYTSSWAALGSGGGGGGSPGGSDTQIQFNDGGTVFAGASNLHYFKSNGVVIANAGVNSTTTSTGTMQIVGGVGVTGNINAGAIYSDIHNYANGVSVVTTLSTAITTANTNMKGYVDGEISTTTSAITTANVNMKGYVDAANTIQSNQISGANLAITTANTNMKGYVDGEISTTTSAITTANTNLKGYVDQANTIQSNQIAGANAAITTANTAMKSYVDSSISNLINGAPGTLDTLNEIAAALGNDANLSVTLTNQIAGVQGNVTAANAAIVTANTNMKGYVDSVDSTKAPLANPTFTGNVTAGNLSATNLTGTLLTASQPNITSVGTLTALNTGGAINTGSGVSTGTAYIELGGLRSGNGAAYIDYHSVGPATDYEARTIRNSGPNGSFQHINLGTGAFELTQLGLGDILLRTNNTTRLTVASGGDVTVAGNLNSGNLVVNSSSAASWGIVSNTNAYQTSLSVNTALGSLAVGWGTSTSPGAFMSMTATGGTNNINSVNRNFKINFTGINDALLMYAANAAVVISSNVVSTSTTTGALVVNGGVGVAGNVTTNNVTVTKDLIFKNEAQRTSRIFCAEDINVWAYSGNSFLVSGQETNPTGLFFKGDGLKLYIIGTTADRIFEYNLSTAWDVSTATFLQQSAIVDDTVPEDLFFSPDGTRCYIVGNTTDSAFEYALSTAWDVSTISLTTSRTMTNLGITENTPTGIALKPDGTQMFIVGTQSDAVHVFNLSTPWSLSSATLSVTRTFIDISPLAILPTPSSIDFNSAGTLFTVTDSTADSIFQFECLTAWDVSTAVYLGKSYIGFQELTPAGVFFSPSQSKAWIVGQTADRVFEYDITAPGLFLDSDINFVKSQTEFGGPVYFDTFINSRGNFRNEGTLTQTGTTTISGGTTLSGAVTMSTTTGAINIHTSQTTGAFILGGTGATGAITLGRSTGNQTINLANGATTSGNTKVLDIGTAGLSGSTTNINIGSAVAGSTTAVSINGNTTVSGSMTFSNSGTIKRGILGTVGDNDQWFIGGGATASNAGFLEIATGDDGTEPIHVRQYGPGNPLTGTLVRTATILDASGNTSFPGTVTASTFVGALTGNASTATTLQTARNIGGVSFNGSADINLPGVNTTGNQNTTGSAASLTTARAINGVNFNGTAAITVPAAAGTLTGATLASGVTASSLTSVGTLTGLTVSGVSLFGGYSQIAGNSSFVGIKYPGGGTQYGIALQPTADTTNAMTFFNAAGSVVGSITQTASALTFNGTSTSARYADLAEKYTADSDYSPGTVVVFGGDKEVTISLTSHDPSVAGVVSTNPAHLMNDSIEGVAVALQGRVPCQVLGPVSKGDRVVSSNIQGVAERLDMTKYQPGCIIGKALESIPNGEITTIEVVVGRN